MGAMLSSSVAEIVTEVTTEFGRMMLARSVFETALINRLVAVTGETAETILSGMLVGLDV